MKPQFLKINTPTDSSINVFEQSSSYFPTPWHYHPELEIVYVQKGTGQKFIGSSVSTFQPGDLCIIGPFLPHVYKNGPEYFESKSTKVAESIVIHFATECFGQGFFDIPECQKILTLLNRAKRGIQFNEETSELVKQKMLNLKKKRGVKRLVAFIEILSILSEAKEVEYLTANPIHFRNESDSVRIQRVLEFLSENFKKDIKLEQVADLANLSESAFSRYFKKRTKRTFSNFLSEIRIDYACKLLQKEEYSVSQVSFESGFNNLSNFNRQFKSIKKTTPLAYRLNFLNS